MAPVLHGTSRVRGGGRLVTRAARGGLAAALLAVPLLVVPPGVGPAGAAGPVARATTVDDQPGDATYYVVKESWEGQPEFLYSIAERLLGTGDRAMEIYELNEGRAQPGGATVSDPNVIRPGWVLVLPPDAVGDGVLVGPLPTLPPRATPSASPAEEAADAAPTSAPDPTAQPARDTRSEPDAFVTTGLAVVAAVTAAIATVVLLVGGVRVVVRRRRAQRAALPAPVVRREDPGAWTIDRTTRALARACTDAGRPVPGVHALVLSDDQVRLRLSTPDARPPAGWVADEDGRTWTSPMRRLQDVALDENVVAPFPRLVTLGDDAQGRVLVDLGQAGPGIALDGDPAQAARLAERWLQELAASPWSRHVPVVAVGAGPSSYARIEDVGAAVDAAGGGVLVVTNARPRDADLLAALADDPAWSVVVVGPAGRGWARWRLTLDADGVASGGPLDSDVHLRAGEHRLELV